MMKPKAKKGDQSTNVDEQLVEKQTLTEQVASATPSDETVALSPILAAIQASIQVMDKSMNDRFNSIENTLWQMQTSLSETNSRNSKLEGARTEHENRISVLETLCQDIAVANKALHAKLDDLEGCSHQQNIKITGLQEKVENNRPAEFVEKLIPALLGVQNFPSRVKVDHIGPLPAKGGHPRTLIARIHHYPIKELILKLSRQQSPLQFEGMQISIYPDLTAEVLSQRAETLMELKRNERRLVSDMDCCSLHVLSSLTDRKKESLIQSRMPKHLPVQSPLHLDFLMHAHLIWTILTVGLCKWNLDPMSMLLFMHCHTD
ncbi:uncharacterized protein LOC125279679 [Megalobrama amblycephala]|uniref:uncharacterized protein LOC125279679 n=1 Tax=Megalobrama amblycephala TaxID=75352 RepID=UPI0020141925|nr:uncharacterized protein LOC125279679 [Megalobrama amblycephala]XP_048065574.1 uncharacterized protein LOC125279679 [Megalobrama amblycephala]XP_048065575.1 uncharacterized protein LOC125279679 [Megalobrama amblycephala]XP_048065577.1 uncharacterized protein LOC125279679 [Megalobrama amblycephala]XP_048065578.1 uncharacterized protein LOC125279679 [Megalobrama amblycephala]